MRNWNIDNDGIVKQTIIQKGEADCPRCGMKYFYLKPESMIDWEKEYNYMRKRYTRLCDELNSLMQFCEYEYGLNPVKEKLVKNLLDLRDKFDK
jgi:hypothetical protein